MTLARPTVRRFLIILAALLLASASLPRAGAAEPLRVRIDQAIAAKAPVVAPRSSDAEFVRRVWLDLAGRVPPVAETKAFLADTAPDKRAKLIDRLIDSPDFARRMMYVFDVMLNERRDGNSVPYAEWLEYLRSSFAARKPYNELVGEILASDGVVNRPAGRFYLERGDVNVLTRDVSRLFFGMDTQCCQCHDHPLVDSYRQTHYYGIYAFLNRSFVFNDPAKKMVVFAEKGDGDVAFKSVFDSSVDEKDFKPRLPNDAPLETEPALAKGEEYFVKPADNKVRPIPKYSRREQLARLAAAGQNAMFNKNIANRLWALMMGRGLVHPVEWHHEGNPPSHPELLEDLAGEFVAMKYDVASFLKELALSETYQRASEIPAGMTPEQAAPQLFAVAALKPLSSEQLTWSLMEAAGLVEAQRNAQSARFVNDRRLVDAFSLDEKRQRQRAEMIEQAVYASLQGNVNAFVPLYGGAEGEPEQDFQATVHQALFLSNGPVVRGWLTNLAGRVQAIGDLRSAADELYLSILSRPPTEEERFEAVEYLLRRAPDRNTGAQEIAWALMASAEFRFNH
jgi:hypothetical protein